MNFDDVCFRLHEPRWSVDPLSGAGAGLHGRRFNRRGADTLYLSTSLEAAFHEVRQGRTIIDPHTLVCYRTNCQNIADLRTEDERKAHSAPLTDLACAWSSIVAGGGTPPSWLIADKLMVDHDGLLAPSFAAGADIDKHFNLVLWKWTGSSATKVEAYDPHGRLPKDQESWRTP